MTPKPLSTIEHASRAAAGAFIAMWFGPILFGPHDDGVYLLYSLPIYALIGAVVAWFALE